jgi:3-hydroxyacyl-[acyl-carrier-protein] dehydratase
MLKDDFFKIISLKHQNNSIKVVFELNKKHKIFEGHFPDQPILPGACMLQMLKEILQDIFGKKLQLSKAHQIKFLSLINPDKENKCEFEIDYKQDGNAIINISAKLLQNTVSCFKFSGIFKN